MTSGLQNKTLTISDIATAGLTIKVYGSTAPLVTSPHNDGSHNMTAATDAVENTSAFSRSIAITLTHASWHHSINNIDKILCSFTDDLG